YRVKLEKHPGAAGEPVDVLRKRVRVTDDTGAVWECVTHCTPEVFFENLVNLDDVGTMGMGDWEQPPPADALTGIRAVLDDGAGRDEGGWRCPLVRGFLVAFWGRRQPRLGGGVPHAAGFSARITGLEGRRRAAGTGRWDVYLDPEHGDLDPSAWAADHPLPP